MAIPQEVDIEGIGVAALCHPWYALHSVAEGQRTAAVGAHGCRRIVDYRPSRAREYAVVERQRAFRAVIAVEGAHGALEIFGVGHAVVPCRGIVAVCGERSRVEAWVAALAVVQPHVVGAYVECAVGFGHVGVWHG